MIEGRKRRWFHAALAVLLATGLLLTLYGAPALADDADKAATKKDPDKAGQTHAMGEVTVQSTKMDKDISQVTDAVTVIQEQDISLSGITDFTDLLRYTPSVQFKRAGGPGQYVYTKVRGFGDGHFVVLIDGMKVNEATSAGSGNMFSKLDPYLLERIEVLRGPQAVLYGSDTTAGVISMTTKGGLPGLNFNVGAEYGTYNWMKGFAGFRGQSGAFRYAVNAIYVNSDNVIEYEDFKNFSPQIKLGYSWGETLDVEASFMHIQSEWNYADLNESYDFCRSRSDWWAFLAPDPERWNKEDYDLATLNVKHKINDSLRQKVMLGWYRKKTEGNNPNNGLLYWYTAPKDNFTLDYVNYYMKGQSVPVYDDGDGVSSFYENENIQVDYNFIWDQHLDAGLNTLLLGLGYQNQDGKKWGKYGDAGNRLETKSVYLNDQIMLFNEALVLNAGVRYDDHKDFGEQVNWKLGAAYSFHDAGTTLYTNYGTSFRAPTIFNLYDPTYGNADLVPEEGWTVEGGVRQTLLGGKFQCELGAWHTELEDVITWVGGPVGPQLKGQYQNRDKQTTYGLEFSFRWQFHENFTLLGNYTFTESETEEGEEIYRTVQIARNNANLGIEYQLGDKLFVGLHAYYTGPRLRWNGDISMDEYIRVDATGKYVFYDGLSVFARVNNMLDADIEEGLGYEQPGIYVVGGLQWDFHIPAPK